MNGMNETREKEYQAMIERRLDELLPEEAAPQADLVRAMRYSLLAGGKRIRPMLVLEFCRVCGGDVNAALPFACAVEMIHTYSLIHDDLPCMDDDDLRRGRPSNHKVYGEAEALLAGDSLLTLAFETMLDSVAGVGAEKAAKAAGILARAAGYRGMAGGQAIDLKSEGRSVSLETLKIMDGCKTGALIAAAAQMGCVLGGADERRLSAAERYARSVGLAFQIVDDVLDVTGDTEQLGKPAGSDAENGKATYVALMGLEKAGSAVRELTEDAAAALACFGPEAEGLADFARRLADRKN